MSKSLSPTPLSVAVKRATLCAATSTLLVATPVAQAMEVKVGGYVKVNATYDLDQDLGDSLDATVIDTTPGLASEQYFGMNANETRINVTATHDDLKIFVEADFAGGQGSELISNSAHFRLRHAYGQKGNFLAGQTWSTFMDANWVLYPTTVDFAGPAGATFIRQAQFRWTVAEGLDLAIENPESDIRGEINQDTLPDFVARYAKKGNISWQVAGLLQRFQVDGGVNDNDSATNLAATAGINIATSSGSFSAKINLNSNRYSYYGWLNPTAVMSGGSLEPIDQVATVIAYNHDWGGASQGSSTFAFGNVSFDDKYLAPTDVDSVSTLHFNYRWIPYENVTFMAELSHADKALVNGNSGDDTRLQYAVKFDF
jgi:hypothetical protein